MGFPLTVLPAPEDPVEFAALMVAPVVEEVTAEEPSASAGPEIVLGAVSVRLEPGASAVRPVWMLALIGSWPVAMRGTARLSGSWGL